MAVSARSGWGGFVDTRGGGNCDAYALAVVGLDAIALSMNTSAAARK
jgi:hypothetical protein